MPEKKPENVRIGNQVRIAREAAGLTQEKFAERISLTPQNVSAIERGVKGFSVPALMRICDTLSISSDDLLFGKRTDLRGQNDIASISEKLGRLSPRQFEIVSNVINNLLDAFSLSEQ